jgi:hypothetical protein
MTFNTPAERSAFLAAANTAARQVVIERKRDERLLAAMLAARTRDA